MRKIGLSLKIAFKILAIPMTQAKISGVCRKYATVFAKKSQTLRLVRICVLVYHEQFN